MLTPLEFNSLLIDFFINEKIIRIKYPIHIL
jgi:hypothetical protein